MNETENIDKLVIKCISGYYYNNTKHLITGNNARKGKVSLFLKTVMNYFAKEVHTEIGYLLDEEEEALRDVNPEVIKLIEGKISGMSINEINSLVEEYLKIYNSGNFHLKFDILANYLNENIFISKLDNEVITLLALSIMKDCYVERFDAIPSVGNSLSEPQRIIPYITNLLKSIDLNLSKFPNFIENKYIIELDNPYTANFISLVSTGGFIIRNRPENDNIENLKSVTKNLMLSVKDKSSSNLNEEELEALVTKCITRYYYNNTKHLITSNSTRKSKVSLFLKTVMNYFAKEVYNQVGYILDEEEEALNNINLEVLKLIEGKITRMSVDEVNSLVEEYFKIYRHGNFNLNFDTLANYLNESIFISKLDNEIISLFALSIMKDCHEERFDTIPSVGNSLSEPERIISYITNLLKSIDSTLVKFDSFTKGKNTISLDNPYITNFISLVSTGGFIIRNRPENDNIDNLKLVTQNLISSLKGNSSSNLNEEEIDKLLIKIITRYYYNNSKNFITTDKRKRGKVSNFTKEIMRNFASEVYYQVKEVLIPNDIPENIHPEFYNFMDGKIKGLNEDTLNELVKELFRIFVDEFDLDFNSLIRYLNNSLILSKLDNNLSVNLANSIMSDIYNERFDSIEYIGNPLDNPHVAVDYVVKVLTSIDKLFLPNEGFVKSNYVFTEENPYIKDFIKLISKGGYVQAFRPANDDIEKLKHLISNILSSVPSKLSNPLDKNVDEKDNKRIERLLALCINNKELLKNNGIEFLNETSKTGVNYVLFKFMNNDGSFKLILVHPQFISSNFEGNTSVLYKKEPETSTFKSFSEFLSSNISKIGINKSQAVIFNYALLAFDLRKSIN